MAENSGIEWTHHTFNPWIGCTKISEACDHCYAAEWDKRYEGGKHWGPTAPRRRTSDSNWRTPLKWNRIAGEKGIRLRVFCASLADVFDNKVDPSWRVDLFRLISETPHLDWLLLTKRPQNIHKMLPPDWGYGYPNVWLGTTVEHQKAADKNILPLLNVPARIRFLSCEPLLGPISLSHIHADLRHIGGPDYFDALRWSGSKIDWVITGGESGSHFRPADADWFRALRDQCAAAGTAFLFKQWEGATQPIIKAKGRELDGVVHDGYPA